MQEHPIRITICSVQTLSGEAERVEQTAPGALRREGEKLLLTYREGEGGSIRTALRLEGDKVTLLRSGELGCSLVFTPGLRHDSTYRTPYGSFPISVTARRVEPRGGEAGGELELEYDLDLSGERAGTILFRMTWELTDGI